MILDVNTVLETGFAPSDSGTNAGAGKGTYKAQKCDGGGGSTRGKSLASLTG